LLAVLLLLVVVSVVGAKAAAEEEVSVVSVGEVIDGVLQVLGVDSGSSIIVRQSTPLAVDEHFWIFVQAWIARRGPLVCQVRSRLFSTKQENGHNGVGIFLHYPAPIAPNSATP
jgi:hypothetical protein